MVMLDEDFDSTEYESSGYDPLPPGEYKLCAVSSEMKDTKAKTGKYISFEFQVLSEQGKGRKIYSNYNWSNSNERAVQIGKEQFASLCRSCKILKPESTEQLHNIPFRAIVGIQEGSGQYGPSNVIKKYIEPEQSGKVFKKVKAAAVSAKEEKTPFEEEDDIPF